MTNLEAAIDRIEKARLAYDSKLIVRLLAVSKYSSAEEVASLFAEGQRAFGENRVQDLAAKQNALAALPIEWHFIGVLQSNKINKLIDQKPAIVHSIDSVELARAYQTRLEKRSATQCALLQINSAREPSKSGVAPEAAIDAYAEIAATCPRLLMEGAMTIGAHSDDLRIVAASFETTRKIFDRLPNAKTLSMGMSGDFELAISFGANLVRLGGALFKSDA